MDIRPVTDRPLWEEFLQKHGDWNLFQSWTWGEVQKTLGYDMSRVGIFDQNRLVGVAQLVFVPAKRGKFIHIRHGPIFSSRVIEVKQLVPLLEYVRDMAKREHAWFVRMSPLVEDSPTTKNTLQQLNFRPAPIPAQDAEISWVLDLKADEADLLARMRKTTRYLIRQAEKVGVVVEESQDIEAFFELYRQTAQRQAFVPHKGIREEFEIFKAEGKALLLLSRHQHQILAAAIIIFHQNEAIYHHGASIPGKIPAPYLLQWRAILEAKKRGMKVYNFWGIAPNDDKNHPWFGISLFKQGFGGRSLSFLHAHDLPLSPQYAISYMIENARRVARGY